MTWRDLLVIRVKEAGGIEVHVSWVLIALFVFIALLCVVIRYVVWKRNASFQLVEAEVKLGEIGSIKIRPSYEEVQIAYRAWVELSTRKAALPFDEQDDVITEVYSSWYELFGRMRDLAKEIPAQRLRSSKDTQELVRLLVEALNKGLRPHLTKWQAKFRRWYGQQLDAEKNKSPQEIQREYPQYDALVTELKIVSQQVTEYAEVLKKIARG
jgi:hypothetical protein